jgi:hypothetical protein
MTDILNMPPLPPRDQFEFTLGEKRKNYKLRCAVRKRMMRKLTLIFKKIGLVTERLKAHGLSGSEGSRLNQYTSKIMTAMYHLIKLKDFRTPQATRAFARVYILITPIFYGPYFADVAENGTNLVYAVSLAVMTSLALVGLFNVQKGLEDPFRSGIDSIDMNEWMSDFRTQIGDAEDQPQTQRHKPQDSPLDCV